MFKPKLLSEMNAREIRLMRVLVRRDANRIARSLGFRNYAEWQGE